MKTYKVRQDELDVLKALDRIGGGGSPIDIAVEGLLDINEVRDTTERLWGRGTLLSHRLPDLVEKRFFAFSEKGKTEYKKLLASLDDFNE